MDVDQNPAWTNHCFCRCCHKSDLPWSQCIVFKESWYNFTNTTVIEALSTRFSVPTSKEFICKKCDAALAAEKCQFTLLQHAQEQPQQTSKSVCSMELCVLIIYIILIAKHMGKITLPLELQKIK